MKTLNELLKQEPVFLNDWSESKRIGLIGDFEYLYITKDEYEAIECPIPNKDYWIEEKQKVYEAIKKYENIKILFATYGNSNNYEGDAWVLFAENNELFEVNGGHSSCYGLEGQWEKEPVVLEELKNRLEKETFGTDSYADNEFATELKLFLGL
jgi:hypothetical protein